MPTNNSPTISLTRTIRYATALLTFLSCLPPPTAHAAPRLTIGTHGRIRVDGTPTIPFGVYHISWTPDEDGTPRLGEELVEDIQTIASRGLNLIHYNIEHSTGSVPALPTAAQGGMLVIGELLHGWWLPGSAQRNAFTALSATREAAPLVAWNICDDINWRDKARELPIDPHTLRERRDLIKSRAPNQLSYASGVALDAAHDSAIRSMRDYQNTADILGFTSYTLGDESGIPEEEALEQTVRNYRALEEAFAGTDQALFAIPQLFRFPNNPEPTMTELRNAVYAALMHGIDGILGYAFYTEYSSIKVFLPRTNPTLLNDLGHLAREIRILTPWFTEAVRSHLPSTTRSLHATSWRRDDRELIMVLSTDRSRPLSFSPPSPLSGEGIYELVPDTTAGLREEKRDGDASPVASSSLTLHPGQVRLFIRTRPTFQPATLAPVNTPPPSSTGE